MANKMTIKEKKDFLHKNYVFNFTRYKSAEEDGYYLECTTIIYAIIEQMTRNILINLASIKKDYHDYIKDEFPNKKKNSFIPLKTKVNVILKFINNYEKDFIKILKKEERIVLLRDKLNELFNLLDNRNEFVHNLMLSKAKYEDLLNINDNLVKCFRTLSNSNRLIKEYAKNNKHSIDVDDIVEILEK